MEEKDQPALQILLRSPEITLKGRNQGDFWAQLRVNVRHALRQRGIPWQVKRTRGRLYVEAHDYSNDTLRTAVETLEQMAGVTSVAVAQRLARTELIRDGELDRKLVEQVVLRLARESYEPGLSFAVRAHRVDKRFPLPSAELEHWLGQVIRERTDWNEVRLESPDLTLYIDIYADSVFFYTDRPKGIGGLPVGSSGHVLALLSGGIDSPVASYLVARRGCTVDFFHMSATHVSEEDFEKSVPGRLALQLSRYTIRSRLFVVPYTHFDLALRGRNTGYETVLFRRFLFRVAEALAGRLRVNALVTGDSLSQVASQTIEKLIASDKAIDFPVLRPLIGLDKQEIMAIAERIGTYETSIEPYKDCCALFTRRTRTRTRDAVLSSMERKQFPSYDELIAASLADTMWAEYDCGSLLETHREASDLDEPALVHLQAR